MQPAHVRDPISASFGDDTPVVTYDHIAAQIRALKPRALIANQLDDVITLIEWMRDETLKAHERNAKVSLELAEREKLVARREKDVSLRQRAHDAATRTRGFLRYFGR